MNPDLNGKTCLITGASGGIGKEAALALADMGAELILVCRDRQRAEVTKQEIQARAPEASVDILLGDLSAQAEVRRVAAEFLATGRPLHLLLNNAGALFVDRGETVDGIERTFALNHLAYFLLTQLLLERIRESAPARIVNVASRAHENAKHGIDFEDIRGERRYQGLKAYGQSKLANILFSRALARRLEGTGVTSNALHPGFVATGFGHNNSNLVRFGMKLLSPFARSPRKGSETSIYLCSSPEVNAVSGEYFVDCQIAQPSAAARDDAAARKLWETSCTLTGIER